MNKNEFDDMKKIERNKIRAFFESGRGHIITWEPQQEEGQTVSWIGKCEVDGCNGVMTASLTSYSIIPWQCKRFSQVTCINPRNN